MYLGSPLVWVVVVAFHVANLFFVVVREPRWSTITALLVLLALLLAPPTRRHCRPDPSRPASRAGRALRLGGAAVAGLFLGAIMYFALLAPGPVGGDLELVRGDRPGVRVLFVGNRLTSDNSMPRTVRRLAGSERGQPPLFTVRYARPGSTLEEAVDDDALQALLDGERWDFVVLQEHSQVVSRPARRRSRSLTAAIELERLARRAGARTVLFENPGYEDGDEELANADTYDAMQERIGNGTRELAARLSAGLAPVGTAWRMVRTRQPNLDLRASDRERPSEAGSYLTACVLYAVLTGRDVAASRFDGGLGPAQARDLRQIATEAVRETS